MSKRYKSQSDIPSERTSFIEFASSQKYKNHLAVGMHIGGKYGMHYVILNAEQVDDLHSSLSDYIDRRNSRQDGYIIGKDI